MATTTIEVSKIIEIIDNRLFNQISNHLTFCAWIYPQWSRWESWFGIFEITTSEAILGQIDTIAIDIFKLPEGTLDAWAEYAHNFIFKHSEVGCCYILFFYHLP